MYVYTIYVIGENDIEMFQYVKHPIAVANAKDILKKHAGIFQLELQLELKCLLQYISLIFEY